MNPRVVVIAGPSKGTVVALSDGEISVGREASNELSVYDPSVSRRHCLIKSVDGRLLVADLDSFNGTFVNGVPIKQHPLEHGDQISIGDTLLLVLLEDDESATALNQVQLDDGNLLTGSTVRLLREDALYLQPERVVASLPPTARVARDLGGLLKISTRVSSLRSLEALQREVLESLLEVVPAERGAILLADESLEDFTSVFGLNKLAEPERPVWVSRTVAAQVLREGVALLGNDIFEGGDFSQAASLVASRTRSLLCAPLLTGERASGLIYLDTTSPVGRFDEGHLQLLTAVASIASIALENVRQVEGLKDENRRLSEEIKIDHSMIGESRRMEEVYRFIGRVAASASTILIRGESGTGKELAARAIHTNSARAGRPFVAINCATLTEALLESELFGHERGAFTGAVAQKKGKLEMADGGTLFLDEVGELAPALQSKLLRVLQEREFERVGGTRTIKVDVRVLAATNRDLTEAVRRGEFRQDLYYRLDVVSFEMPPLRARREDIPLLANFFAAKYAKKCKRRVRGISPRARACLLGYDWPGNVRELENAIERAVVLGATPLISHEDLPEAVSEASPAASEDDGGGAGAGYYEAVREAKKQLIVKAIEQAGGSYTEAAKILGVHPNNLHRLIRTLDLKSRLDKT